MFHVALVNPEIPPNTGNIIRLCANTGCSLHLIKPLGFSLDDRLLRRAGLDYHEYANINIHNSWLEAKIHFNTNRCFAITTKGKENYHHVSFEPGDVFVFGSETSGLPQDIRSSIASKQHLRIPMLPEQRSLNLSNSVAVLVFEAWRQQGFIHAQ